MTCVRAIHKVTCCYKKENIVRNEMGFAEVARAVATDIHFLIPVVVLLVGVALLIKLH